MTIAFFDFDGTITRGDSFAMFLKFVLGGRFYFKMIENLPTLIAYKLGMIDNAMAKEKVLTSCLGGMDSKFLESKCNEFLPKLQAFCKDSALEKMRWHKESGHKVVLVSASFEEYLRPICNAWGIELLATCMEIKDGKITGKFSKPNCYGIEKENRIKAAYDLESYKSIYAYGDTRGDREMLALASQNQAFFRVFE